MWDTVSALDILWKGPVVAARSSSSHSEVHNVQRQSPALLASISVEYVYCRQLWFVDDLLEVTQGTVQEDRAMFFSPLLRWKGPRWLPTSFARSQPCVVLSWQEEQTSGFVCYKTPPPIRGNTSKLMLHAVTSHYRRQASIHTNIALC